MPQCSKQHYLQKPKHGNNPSAYQQTTDLRRCSVNTYTHTHTHTHTHIHMHTDTYTHIHIYTEIHTHIYTERYTHTCTHMYTYMHTDRQTYTHIHTYNGVLLSPNEEWRMAICSSMDRPREYYTTEVSERKINIIW